MIGFYNYTVIATYISLFISSCGICFAVAGEPLWAVLCLMASGFCDMFDGKIARTRKRSTSEEKRFGIQLDSLCDIVCFGVLPAVIGISMVERYSAAWYVTLLVGGALILCALIRLAYFNVTEETRQSTVGGRRTYFEGLPVTSSAVVFPFAFGVAELVPAAVAPWVYVAFAAVTALCFILPFRMRKPHGVGLVLVALLGLCELAGLVTILIFG